MALDAGATVGRYQIKGLLGSGGMGEVYKAVDPTLGRPVALKVLRPELSGDPERLSRFLHEARAASALNHPNILTVHEVGDHDRSRYLVTELVEGETLRQRLARGSLTLREVLDITIQAASALSAAHAASIVHRDIKPDNLMLRPDGYVKVLDFGVATMTRPKTADAMATMATMDAHETGPGMIVGTIAYMSPEQARGLTVDGRSDCYSLGVVLYELVTGRAPFAAPTTTDLLVAILEREPPPIRTVARGLPLQLEWIIEKALEKDPNLRYQSMADLRVDLQRLKSALQSGKVSSAPTDSAAGSVVSSADAVLERELTDDSPEVAAVSGVSWMTAAGAGAAAIVFGIAMAYYSRARPGADLPLTLPEGAVLTKARDAVAGFGYSGLGSRTSVTFIDAVDIEQITSMAGLPAARDAIREGAPVAYWRAGITHTANPTTGLDAMAAGDYSVRLDPKGELVAFATGYSTDSRVTHADRARAAAIGLDAIKKAFGIDASGYELEVIERSFPAGKTEMAWRSPATKYGHVEQLQVSLQGEKLILIERSLERPRGYKEPPRPMLMRIFQGITPVVIVGVFLGGWGFGLYYLFKTKNWDALTRRIPLAICLLVIVQVALGNNGNSGPLGTLAAVVAIAILLLGTVLPALSGVMLWIGRQSPARMWAAEQITRGRFFTPSVPASLVDGVSLGALVAGLTVLVDWAALTVPGFEPSISRELNIVDAGIGATIGSAVSTSTFLALAIAFAIEVFNRFKVPTMVSTAVISVAAGCTAASDQEALLAALTVTAGYALAAVMVCVIYRRRGFLAAWVGCFVASLLPDALAARSLDDPELLRTTNTLFTVVVAIAAAGAWGVGRRLLQKPVTVTSAS